MVQTIQVSPYVFCCPGFYLTLSWLRLPSYLTFYLLLASCTQPTFYLTFGEIKKVLAFYLTFVATQEIEARLARDRR
jgi:hypothetical protein